MTDDTSKIISLNYARVAHLPDAHVRIAAHVAEMASQQAVTAEIMRDAMGLPGDADAEIAREVMIAAGWRTEWCGIVRGWRIWRDKAPTPAAPTQPPRNTGRRAA